MKHSEEDNSVYAFSFTACGIRGSSVLGVMDLENVWLECVFCVDVLYIMN